MAQYAACLLALLPWLVCLFSCQENADEMEMLRRVDELTDKLLREKFPDAYTPAPRKKRVRWLAYR